LEEVKKAEQDRLLVWSKQQNLPDYEAALLTMEQLIYERKDLRFRSWMLDEAIFRGIEFVKVPTDITHLCDAFVFDG
jgi:hypothetical protein